MKVKELMELLSAENLTRGGFGQEVTCGYLRFAQLGAGPAGPAWPG